MTPASPQPLPAEDPWASATFEGNRRAQLQEWAKMPFDKKIEWLEEAQRLAEAFAAARPGVRSVVPPHA